ncbi:MAG: zinc-regulated TonB-dependent outer membrane receptor [Candidatus Manganitrophaceae bacterium]|nr:MAG: zinc-regulated TonB-dependent outer membrane receptor [Candidatus Manganitrophaceae bacterium]
MRSILLALAVLGAILGIVPSLSAQEGTTPLTRSAQTLNPEISLDGLFSAATFSDPEHLQFGAHDPNKRGFTLQNLELTLAGNVDPYFRGEAHLIFGLEAGESFVEVEEAFLTTLSLPYGLQIMGGHFFTRFGRQNPLHPHAWAFTDQNMINTLMFGGDGLRSPGVQISVLLPLPFYLELIGSVQNAEGETASSFLFTPDETFAGRPILTRDVHDAGDLLTLGRIKSSFDLSETVSLVAGTSHLFGPNGTGENTATRIHGVDLFLKWEPLTADHGWPFVTLQGEAMRRSYEAGEATLDDGTVLSQERFETDGFYIQSLYGFKRRWVAGVRYERSDATDPVEPASGARWRASSNLTFYPSEFSKIRLQYNYDKSDDRDDPIHAVFVQYEFLIGAHGAHTF